MDGYCHCTTGAAGRGTKTWLSSAERTGQPERCGPILAPRAGPPIRGEAPTVLCLAEPWVGIPCGATRTSCQGPVRVWSMISGDDVVKRLWVRGWCEVTDSGKKRPACFLYPTCPPFSGLPQDLTSYTSGTGPQAQALGITQGDWGRVSGALLGLPDNGLNFNPLGPPLSSVTSDLTRYLSLPGPWLPKSKSGRHEGLVLLRIAARMAWPLLPGSAGSEFTLGAFLLFLITVCFLVVFLSPSCFLSILQA